MFVVASWNLNSILARIQHLVDFLKSTDVDLILLQEIKCIDQKFPYSIFEDLGYNCLVVGQKTYNGVAILSKYPLERESLSLIDSDEQARYVEALVTKNQMVFRVASVYVPNGKEVGSESFEYKLLFLRALSARVKELLENKEMLIIGGDYNVAVEAIDVHDPIKAEDKLCFHHLERQGFRELLNHGMIDALRALHPSIQQFTWWDYRGGSWNKNHGMRLDYLLLSPEAADVLKSCAVETRLRGLPKPSDHAPVVARFNTERNQIQSTLDM